MQAWRNPIKPNRKKEYNIAMNKYRLAVIIAAVCSVALYLIVVQRSGPTVLVRADQQYKETVYSLRGADQKEVSFTTYQTEINDWVLRWRSDSTLPLKEQLRLAAKLLDRVKQDRPLSSFKTLSIGRLVEAFGSDRTYSDRLTAAAKDVSPIPFARQNNTVRDLANSRLIYSELQELFQKYGLTLKVAAVEKVLVNETGVPYDGITWFSLLSP
jgi:hypothetical protein